jgi:hypothetical protein
LWVHPKKYNLAWHPYRLEEQSITTSQQLAAARRQPQVKSCMIAHCEVRSIKMIFHLFVAELWQPGFVLYYLNKSYPLNPKLKK